MTGPNLNTSVHTSAHPRSQSREDGCANPYPQVEPPVCWQPGGVREDEGGGGGEEEGGGDLAPTIGTSLPDQCDPSHYNDPSSPDSPCPWVHSHPHQTLTCPLSHLIGVRGAST